MGNRNQAISATPPNLRNEPTIEFRKKNFDAAVWLKGYSVYVEKAVRCPCEGKIKNAYSACENCLGQGYFFINAYKTRALTTGLNKNTEYQSWSPELIGTISISLRDIPDEVMSFYDKITFYDKFSHYSEVIEVRVNPTTLAEFVFLIYRPIEIFDVWLFDTFDNPLVKVPEAEYSISPDNPYAILLSITSKPTNWNGVISIRYKHEVQYNVIDIPHDIRASLIKDNDGRLVKIDMPINAIARKCHLLLVERANLDGSGIQDNSYR